MKIALIQDSLLVCAGSERVFKCMIEEFPEADIFTLAYNKETTCPFFLKYTINTSWINKIIQSHKTFKFFFPISTFVMQFWNFYKYDIIISSSATTAKYISRFSGKHFCFGYFPTRAIWDYDRYFPKLSFSKLFFKLLLPYLKSRDLNAKKRVTTFISQSQVSMLAFKKYYNINAPIIHSPMDYHKFKNGLNEEKSDYYLIVSRLEQWKKIEFAIEAFNEMKKLKLKIIGGGPLMGRFKKIANPNIQLLGNLSDNELVRHYGKAKALIFTPELEYGLTPLESLAAGTPVIAYGKGAVLETMIPFKDNNIFSTAIFFEKQNSTHLLEGISKFETLNFDREKISNYAEKFGEENFRKKLRSFININSKER